MENYIEYLKKEISLLRGKYYEATDESQKEDLLNQIHELKTELDEKDGYQYLSDNDILY